MIPTSVAYYIDTDGKLRSFQRFDNGQSEIALPINYALFYPEKTGKVGTKDMIAKVFIIRNGNHTIKEFYSRKYGNNPIFLREAVEKYILSQLSEPQQTLEVSRKKRKSPKSKIKRCNCK